MAKLTRTSSLYRFLLLLFSLTLLSLNLYLTTVLNLISSRDLLLVLAPLVFASTLPRPPSSLAPTPPLSGPRAFQARLLIALAFALALATPALWLLLTPSPATRALLAPHTFVFASQIILEAAAYSPAASLRRRLAIPLTCTSHRLLLVAEWVPAAAAAAAADGASRADSAMLALAVGNAVFVVGVLGFMTVVVAPKILRGGAKVA